MKYLILFITVISLLSPALSPSVRAEDKPLIKSTVVDVDGKPVQGAYIFFYDSADTKRAVDLVSPVTDADGFCQKKIPPGTYWVLARLKENADFDMGPLMIGDKVSGDPMEIEAKLGQLLELNFTVLNLLDNITLSSKKREDLNRISGQIVDKKGKALVNSYAFANRHNKDVTIPGYFSAWTEEDGHFTIFLPTGTYYLGSKKTFGPDQRYKAEMQLVVDGDKEGVELVFKAARN